MVKTKTPQKNQKQTKSMSRQNPRRTTFGPVSTISTAPTAIGNSVRGASSKVTNIPGGVRVTGRDFALVASGTGSVTTWLPCAGMPITPAVMGSTVLKQYLNMYSHYKINAVVAHYITSSPTSSSGDVMFYVQKTHSDPMVNWTSNNFLPFVMSDDATVIGPQWTNSSTVYRPEPVWTKTDYITNDDETDDACGDLFLFSRTSTTDSPGYVLLDYEIEFRGLQLNVKNTIYPVARGIWTQVNLGATAAAVTINSTPVSVSVVGNTIDGSVSTLPTGNSTGDVYKIFIDITNSVPASWTGPNQNQLLNFQNPSNVNATISDGYTLYGVLTNTGALYLYPTFQAALSGAAVFRYGYTGTITYNLQCWMSLVGATGGSLLQSNI